MGFLLFLVSTVVGQVVAQEQDFHLTEFHFMHMKAVASAPALGIALDVDVVEEP